MDVSDDDARQEWLPVPQHPDQSNQYDHEGVNLGQPCGQRDCVSACVLRHWRSVARGACGNSVKEDVTGGMRTPDHVLSQLQRGAGRQHRTIERGRRKQRHHKGEGESSTTQKRRRKTPGSTREEAQQHPRRRAALTKIEGREGTKKTIDENTKRRKHKMTKDNKF